MSPFKVLLTLGALPIYYSNNKCTPSAEFYVRCFTCIHDDQRDGCTLHKIKCK